jgi:excinuclease ABC subunit C
MDIDLKEKVNKLPSCPGVYLMKDSLDSVIYVGKSKNIKRRVGSYFINSKNHSPKVLKLVKNLKNFEYIITDTEFEAFLLESNLIKEMKPMYNKQLKSPKSYSYIRVKLNEKYPSIEISSDSSRNDGNIYFGPYTSKNTVEKGLLGIKECCKILCNNNLRKASSCINYSLGLCIGMCLDNTSRDQHLVILNKIINLLNGTDKSIIKDMEFRMNNASENFDFETAAMYRDYIEAVYYLLDKVIVIKFTEENKNIVLIEYLSNDSFKFFLIKGHKILFSEKYLLADCGLEKLKTNLRNNIVFYFNNESSETSVEIGRDEIDESQIIYSYLKNKSNNCKYAIISEEYIYSTNNYIKIDNLINELVSF